MPLVRRLGLLAALLVAAAAWSAPALAANITPVNDVAPKLSDARPRVGETISVTTGTWHDTDDGSAGQPLAYSYQWFRCSSAIPGATSSSYTTSADDDGCALRATVVARYSFGGFDYAAAASSDSTEAMLAKALAGDHFVVEYTSSRTSSAAITDGQAGDILAFAEQAYAAETALGYTVPGDGSFGGDSRIDIRIDPLPSGVLGVTNWDAWVSPATSWIELNSSDPSNAFTLDVVAHELFHVVQMNIWLPSSESDFWLLEGAAEWLGYRIDGFPTWSLDDIDGDWSMSLDCRNTVSTTPCDLIDDFKGNGYTRWPFFEYLYERYGADAISGIFQQGAGGGVNATTALSRELAAKGGSLADFYTDWAVANVTGGYQVKELQSIAPSVYSSIDAGTLASLNLTTKVGAPKVTSGATPPLNVPVNHLGVRYVKIERGNAAAPDTPCYAATLKLNVTVPSGTGAKPYFWWSQKAKDGTNLQSAQALSISGGTASITVPWDTCQWDSTPAYLILANPSTNVDAATFGISGTLTVDRNTEATPTAPPDPVKLHGTPVDTPTSGGGDGGDVPQVAVFGPQVLRIAPDARQIRLIVQSDGSGQLKAALGSLTLGTKTLRAGGNDLRFTLPTKALKGIRRVSAAASVLTLTPMSSGGAAGKPITRQVVVQAPRKH